MILVFDPTKLPRTMTRDEWREVHRWRRIADRRLRAETERRLVNMICYSTSHPEIWAGFASEVIDPPILIGPYQ